MSSTICDMNGNGHSLIDEKNIVTRKYDSHSLVVEKKIVARNGDSHSLIIIFLDVQETMEVKEGQSLYLCFFIVLKEELSLCVPS